MKNKLVLFNVIILTVAILAIFFSGLSVARDERFDEAKKEIVDVANIYAANYNENIIENVPSHIRLTIVDATGVAIKDSQSADAIGVQHLDREEIQNALKGTPAVVTRYSDTLKKNMAYYAVKVNVDDSYVFVRAAIAVESVQGYIQKSIVVMVCVLIAVLVLSYLASVAASNGILKPLKDVKNNLEAVKNDSYVPSIPSSSDKEINAILAEINDVSEKLHDSMRRESNDKQKLDYILDNISDGIVVLDKGGDIVSINKNACAVFGIKDAVGKNYTVLTADRGFSAHVANCLENGTSCDFEYASGGKFYMVSARTLENETGVLVLSDITAIKTSEKTRSEFFANASHELKTPLTAIKGFNDIIGLQTSESETKALSEKIDREVSRIIALLKDMLDLSELESQKDVNPEDVSLAKIAESVKESLAPVAKEKNVEISIDGDAIVKMEKEHAIELVKNLVENGVKYNRSGGSVKVTISSDASHTTLIVADDGIGIEEKHQQRIFERFYRVNKSRSRETGGTGLGLAIVKHICTLYNADLSLTSKLGVGTTVTVAFRHNL